MEIDSPNATGIISGFGVPTGGTSGQLLQKVNATNYNTQWVNLDTPTYIQARNGSQQALTAAATTIITNWTNLTTNNASEWNATTGTFTATKAGTYFVSAMLSYAALASPAVPIIGSEWNVMIYKNGSAEYTGWGFVTSTNNVIRSTPNANMILTLAVGDTITIRAFHNLVSSGSVALNDRSTANMLTIKELPGKILK